jgi:transcriptional regulator with XRE-family HTH domain
LAELLGCTQQHVSLMLKGTSNLTLETIAKLETALDFSIIGDCLTFVDGYKDMCSTSRNRQYLTEADSPSYGKM